MNLNSGDNLKGTNILLTGGTQGLGLALAFELIKNGANLAICSRNKNDIKSVKQKFDELRHRDQIVYAYLADVSQKKDVEKLYKKTSLHFGKIDILINNAAINGTINDFLNIDSENWKDVIDINILGSVLMVSRYLPDMIKKKNGKIIQLSGGGATSPLPGMSAYAASKAAIVRFIETISMEYADSGVEFNSVAPGMMKTRLLQNMIDSGPQKIGDTLFGKALEHKKKNNDSTENATKLILFLCSNKSQGISGKLISAEWDAWESWPEHISQLRDSDAYTLRRVTGKDRNFNWGDN
jgi:NAD(P)-dependent dehydrogenase (short-subunit alcohol dehydrogenase family)